MKAFASLHTAKPGTQNAHEVFYQGYKRAAVDFFDGFGNQPIDVLFDVIMADSDDVVHYVAIGTSEHEDGDILLTVPTDPMDLKQRPERLTEQFWIDNGATRAQAKDFVVKHGEVAPRVIVCNTAPVTLPENLNPIARIVHQLVMNGQVSISDLHPKLYEAVNDALHNAGVPVLKVTRSGAAKIDIRLSQMPSLDMLGAAH